MAVKVDTVATLFLTGILGISAGALVVNYILDKKNIRDLNTECMKQVKEDTEDMFDDGIEKYESKEERKIDSLTNRVDNLADRINDSNSSKGNSSPVINVSPVMKN